MSTSRKARLIAAAIIFAGLSAFWLYTASLKDGDPRLDLIATFFGLLSFGLVRAIWLLASDSGGAIYRIVSWVGVALCLLASRAMVLTCLGNFNYAIPAIRLTGDALFVNIGSVLWKYRNELK